MTIEQNDKSYSVYMHVFPDGKKYIGATRQDPKKRWHNGRGYRNSKRIYAEICKYDWKDIGHVIVQSGLDKETAMSLEKELIAKYRTQDKEFGLNTKAGGQSFGDHSEEFLESLKERMKGNKFCVGRKISKEHIAALVNGSKKVPHKSGMEGKHHSDETRKRLSESRKKQWQDPVYREKMSKCHADMSGKNNPRYGVKLSDETKRKISESHKRKRMEKQR